jgi:plasmid stabilization system protein ParE
MDFRVEVTARAFDEIDAIADYIRQRGSFESAEKWLLGIEQSLGNLRYTAGIHPVVPGSDEIARTFHVLLHGPKNRRYKIFYFIDAKRRVVHVVHVRHWARKSPTAAEIAELRS